MNERDLFLSALEIEDAGQRQAHLEAACCGNPELLSRVELLLASHEGSSQFLNVPAMEQLHEKKAAGGDATVVMGTGSTQGEDHAAVDTAGLYRLIAEQVENDDEALLSYLQPSPRGDSLGRLAHYEILEIIGRGAFGTVLRAFDDKLHRVVAIKVLAPAMAATSPARKRFLREAQLSAQIRHEHVVNVYAVEEKPIPYLVMEYIPGQTLQQRLEERGPLDVLNVLHLGRQIAEGLAAAHAMDMIHRDIKPGNILLEARTHECVKITDFGLARAADDASMTQSGMIAGTPMYMAPEQALGQKLDQRADLFSFGSVLYQMVSGRAPFRAPSTLAVLKRVTEDTPRPIQEVIPETPSWLCNIIAKLHEKNPDERYQTAQEVADVLANCEAQLKAHDGLQDYSRIPPAPTQPQVQPAQGALPRSMPWQRIAIGALAVILLAAGGYGLFSNLGTAAKSSAHGKELAGWGTVVDPRRDCPLSADENGLTIAIPAGEHNLNPTPQFNNFTAPRVLQSVTGDFELDTRVSAFPPPATKPGGVTRNYVGAGLVLWQDEKNFVRFLRSANGTTGNVFFHIEYFRDGVTIANKSADLPNVPLSLRLVRADGQIHAYCESQSNNWRKVALDAEITLADKLQVGVAATNTSAVPFTARFVHLHLKTNKSASDTNWTPLFNGQDLTGWKTPAAAPGHWEVKDGVLVGSQRRSNLFAERGDYENFHLRVEAKVNLGGDSGVIFRSDPAMRLDTGYEAEIIKINKNLTYARETGTVHIPQPDGPPLVLGLVSDDSLTKPDEWFTLEIIAQGDRFITKVNGVETARCTDSNPRLRGHIGLQVWSANTIVQFRKIEIKELPSSPSADPRTEHHLFASDEWIDLIPLIDPRLDKHGNKLTGKNEWRVDNGELVVGFADAKPNKLLFPLDSDWQAFECELDFTRRTGDSALGLNIPAKASDVPIVVDISGKQVSLGRRAVIGEIPAIPNGERAKVSVRGQKQDDADHLEVTLNGKPVGIWTGNRGAIEGISGEGYAHARRLSLWIPGGSEYVFHQIRVRLLDGGSARTLRPLPEPASHTDATPPLAIAPFDAAQAKAHQLAWAKHLRVPVEYENSLKMKFRLIPPGKFMMGSSPEEIALALKVNEKNRTGGDRRWHHDRIVSEGPAHEVEITKPFYLAATHVTVGQYRKFAEKNGGLIHDGRWDNPGREQTDEHPVVFTAWADTQAFCRWLGEQEKLVYRLPTEAEWELACRAGTTTAFPFGNSEDDLARHGWFKSNSQGHTHTVAKLAANPFGLYDMCGNAWQWCQDPHHVDFYKKSPRQDPQGEGAGNILRGGSWENFAVECRSAFRNSATLAATSQRGTGSGFRVALSVESVRQALDNSRPFTDADAERIAALPVAQQVDEVRKELVRLNPGFDGTLKPTIENDVITELSFNSDTVDNIAPVRALKGLFYLDCRGTYPNKGKLSDLSPLKGLTTIVHIDCSSTQIADLTPLAGLPLTNLQFNHNPVSDLTPLKNMPLLTLGCAETKVADFSALKGLKLKILGAQLLAVTDLSPLEGMPLTGLDLYHTIGVTSLEPLKGMPLEGLNLQDVPVSDLTPLKDMTSLRMLLLQGCKVSDLSPLAGLKLTDLFLLDEQITDLSPLKGMPLKRLGIHGSGITDLSPLQGMELDEIRLTPKNITRGLEILREMKSLKTIGIDGANTWPAAEFWQRYDKGEFAVAPFTDADAARIAALPAKEQFVAVVMELKKRNSEFQGLIDHQIDNDKVTQLSIDGPGVKDVLPIKAMMQLRDLCFVRCQPDVSPLRDLGLTAISFYNSEVADLSMLKGMKVTSMDLSGSRNVVDLSPLKELPLEGLTIYSTQVSDLKPLADMKLKYLNCSASAVTDLSPLKGLPLESLNLDACQVSDLSPLVGSSLTVLYLRGTLVTDLSPLKDVPLKTITLDFQAARDAKHLRAIKTLETINDKPASEFLREAN